MEEAKEIVRYILDNLNLKDSEGIKASRSSLSDWSNIVKIFQNDLSSATNSIVKVTTKIDALGNAISAFDIPKEQKGNADASWARTRAKVETLKGYEADSLGSSTQNYRSVEFNKNFYGAKSKQELRKIMSELNGEVSTNPSKSSPDRMRITFPVSEEDYQNALLESDGDIRKAHDSLKNSFVRKNLSSAVKYSDDVRDNNKEKQEQKDKERQEKQEKQQAQERRRTLSKLAAVAIILKQIADITRRILTAALTRATATTKEAIDAKSLSVSPTTIREFKNTERVMGMEEGTFAKALSSLQSAFGDITNLNTSALSELSKVLQGDIVSAINQGLGKDNPENLLKEILDTYFARGNQGINSIGQQVGKNNAQRELATALEKAGFGDLAEILRYMFYANDNGIYKGSISNTNDFMNAYKLDTMGLDNIDHAVISDIGQVVNELQTKWTTFTENIEKSMLLMLQGLIVKVNNLDFGKSASEKLEEDTENKHKLDNAKKQALKNESAYTDFYTQKLQTKFSEKFDKPEDVKNLLTKFKDGTSLSTDEVNNMKDILSYLNSEEGLETWGAIALADAWAYIAEENQSALDKGKKSGKYNYDASLNSSSKAHQLARDTVLVPSNANTSKMYAVNADKGISNMISLAAYGNSPSTVNTLPLSNEEIWDYYINKQNNGKFDLNDLVSSKKYAIGLKKEIVEEWGKQKGIQVGSGNANTELKKAMKDKDFVNYLINDYKIEEKIIESLGSGEYGISLQAYNRIKSGLKENKQDTWLNPAIAQVKIEELVDELKLNNKLINAEASSNKEGNLVITLNYKDGKEDKKVTTTVAELMAEGMKKMNFTWENGKLVDDAQSRGSTR